MSNNQELKILNNKCIEPKIKLDLSRKKDKVIILGYCPYTLQDVPWDNPDFEIWGMNDLYTQIQRADRWFEMHIRELVERTPRSPNHLQWLRDAKIPIYMHKHYDDIPFSVEYPLQEIMNTFQYGNYLNNSCSYMTALAIHMGFKEIRIYGIDMASDSLLDREYGYQRPSCEYWLGIAAGKGIKILIPPKADMLKLRHQYGYVEDDEAKLKLNARIQDFQGRMAQMEAEKRNVIRGFHDFVIKSEDIPPEFAPQRLKEIRSHMGNTWSQVDAIDRNLAKYQGAIEDAEYAVRVWSHADEKRLFGRGDMYDGQHLFGVPIKKEG